MAKQKDLTTILLGMVAAVSAFTGCIGGVLALGVVAIIVRGFVLTKLWGWFVVPVFGLPALHIAAAVGLSLLLGYLLSTTKEKTSLVGIFANAGAAYLVGWVIHLFM